MCRPFSYPEDVRTLGPMDALARVADYARRCGLPWDDEASDRLQRYVTQLIEGVPRVSATAARTVPEALEILAWPSCVLGLGWDRAAPPRRVADIGSGNGFPGVLAALAWRRAEVALIERRARKAAAIGRALEAAGIHGRAVAIAADAREVPSQHGAWAGTCDLVTTRAVGPLETLNRLSAPLLAPGGMALHWKAHTLDPAEVEAGRRRARGAGLEALEDIELDPDPPGPGRLVRFTRPEAVA